MSTAVEKTPVYCPQCGKRLLVPMTAIGKQGRCPACSHVFLLEMPVAAVVEEDLQPLPNLTGTSSDPFGDGGDYQLEPLPQPASPYAASPYASSPYAASPYATSPHGHSAQTGYSAVPNPYTSQAEPNPDKYNHGFGWEHRGWDSGMVGGLIMMLIAVVWFFGGLLLFGWIFYFPPILFIIGLIGFVRGLVTGNVAG